MKTNAPPGHAVLIAGPTASGKSAIAVELAEKCNGTIVNADAMQVYEDLRILTARPTVDDERRVPHRLYGHVPAHERHSVGRWLDDVAVALDEIRNAERLPIFVGGTGLYFKALQEGLAPVPDIPPNVRERVAGWHAAEGEEGLKARLDLSDGVPSDRHRLIRVLEVREATGKSLSEWQEAEGRPPLREMRAHRVCLTMERDELHARCERRFRAMVADGAVAEVERLLGFGLDPDLPAMKAIGVAELSSCLTGEISLDEAVSAAQTRTRRYVKRQLTWYRGQMRDWPTAAPERATQMLFAELRKVR